GRRRERARVGFLERDNVVLEGIAEAGDQLLDADGRQIRSRRQAAVEQRADDRVVASQGVHALVGGQRRELGRVFGCSRALVAFSEGEGQGERRLKRTVWMSREVAANAVGPRRLALELRAKDLVGKDL